MTDPEKAGSMENETSISNYDDMAIPVLLTASTVKAYEVIFYYKLNSY